MLELLASEYDAISVIRKDHDTFKELFELFEIASDLRQKKRIVAAAIKELKIHAVIEEEIFYPAVRLEIGKKVMTEADEEHHVAKILIAELEQMNGSEEHFEAKFIVLAENIRHHIEEEEQKMLPEAHSVNVNLELLGRSMMARKLELSRGVIPVSPEEKMVTAFMDSEDSPTSTARLRKPKAA